jgi:hypothetical protein
MKEIKLSQRCKKSKNNHLSALVDDADFEYLNQWKWFAHKSPHGTYYAARNDSGKTIKMHRIILGLTDPNILGDHKDGNSLNNQRSNLRECTHSQNNRNCKKYKEGTSKYKGVHYHKKNDNFMARITDNGKTIYLGSFINEVDAGKAFNIAAQRIHGEFANLNII